MAWMASAIVAMPISGTRDEGRRAEAERQRQVAGASGRNREVDDHRTRNPPGPHVNVAGVVPVAKLNRFRVTEISWLVASNETVAVPTAPVSIPRTPGVAVVSSPPLSVATMFTTCADEGEAEMSNAAATAAPQNSRFMSMSPCRGVPRDGERPSRNWTSSRSACGQQVTSGMGHHAYGSRNAFSDRGCPWPSYPAARRAKQDDAQRRPRRPATRGRSRL